MAHPMAGQCKTGQERAAERYADGGPTPTDAEMGRAKNWLRGMDALAPKGWGGRAATWSGKNATDYAGEDTQNMADSIRGQKKGD